MHVQRMDAFRRPADLGFPCSREDRLDDLLAQDQEGGESLDAGDGCVVPAGGARSHDQRLAPEFRQVVGCLAGV